MVTEKTENNEPQEESSQANVAEKQENDEVKVTEETNKLPTPEVIFKPQEEEHQQTIVVQNKFGPKRASGGGKVVEIRAQENADIKQEINDTKQSITEKEEVETKEAADLTSKEVSVPAKEETVTISMEPLIPKPIIPEPKPLDNEKHAATHTNKVGTVKMPPEMMNLINEKVKEKKHDALMNKLDSPKKGKKEKVEKTVKQEEKPKMPASPKRNSHQKKLESGQKTISSFFN